MSKEGFVYVLLNSSFNDYVKIGKTKGTSEERAKQIYNQAKTGIPTKFEVAYENRVSDCGLVERLVHKKLEKKRVSSDREFFRIPLKDAIRAVEEVIRELKNQHKLDFVEISDKVLTKQEWWNNLSSVWQQIFRKHLDLVYEPNEIDLLRATHDIIDHCQDLALRSKVLKLISDKKFTQKLQKWYVSLKNEKKLFDSYLPYVPSKSEIEKILKLENINCSNNIAVIDLKPLTELIHLREINCSNTYVSDLSTLSKLDKLETINLNYTKIDTLIDLENLSKLKKIDCYSTDLQEIERFNFNQNCEIIYDSFLTQPIRKKK